MPSVSAFDTARTLAQAARVAKWRDERVDWAAMDEAEAFRALGHRVVNLLADELGRARRREGPVLPTGTPDEVLARWGAPTAGTDLIELFASVVREGIHLHHPGYAGHQVAVPLPEAALAELVGALGNNAMGVFEMGPVGTAMERRLVEWMAGHVGFVGNFSGVMTSGGSLGNLTALLAARASRAKRDGALAILCGEQAHYSVSRAARAMGLGVDGIVTVPCDARFKLRAAALPLALAEARKRGRTPFAVVGSACSTATGAFDPLPEIADFAAANGLHFHVDAAHGASLLLSPRHRSRLAGIERADTVVWDAHKLLRVPALSTGLLFRDAAVGEGTFEQEASYLFGARAWWDLAQRTFECTKRLMPLPLYVALAGRGEAALASFVEGRVDLATRFFEAIEATSDLECAVAPECNIVCFRPRGASPAEVDAIRARIVTGGDFYLVATSLPERGRWLRVSLMNPDTDDADLVRLLAAVRG